MRVSFWVAEERNGVIVNEALICSCGGKGNSVYIPPIGEMMRFNRIPAEAAELANVKENNAKFAVWKTISMIDLAHGDFFGQHIDVYLKPIP